MSEIIFFYFIAYIVLGLASVSLGILVFVNNKKKVNLIFFLFSLAIALWAFLQAFWMTIDNYDEALFFGRLMVVPVIFIPVLYFHWVLIFLQKKATKRLIVAYTMTGIFVLFSFNDAFISELAQVGPYKYFPQSNWLHKLFLVEWLFLVSCGVFRLFEAYKKATSNKRRQIKMVLIGTLIGFIGGTCNFLFMFGIGFVPPIASLLIFVFLIMMGYAMVEYNLMNVEAVFVKLLLVILNVAAISFIFVSNSTSEYIYKIVFASFIVFVSVLLGKSYQKEIKQKKELLKVSKDLKRANVGLKQLDKSKSEFITIASNQLKTPITVIKGYTSLIAEGVYNDDKEKISSALKKVFAANENLEQLANDLLDVARIESGELEYHWEDVSIEKVLDKVRRVFLTHA
ncbi:MAG: histidine kinase N-terminal 7TM domain-containing protein [Patescibacteria group bacterium]